MTRPDDAFYRFRLGAMKVLAGLLVVVTLLSLYVLPIVFLGQAGIWLSFLFLFGGLFALGTLQGLTRYPEHTVGIEHRVDEDTFDGPRKHCTECGESTTRGLRRRYARQAVLFGVPLHTFEWGINEYCLECAQPGGGPGVDPHDAHGRVETNETSAARELERAFED